MDRPPDTVPITAADQPSFPFLPSLAPFAPMVFSAAPPPPQPQPPQPPPQPQSQPQATAAAAAAAAAAATVQVHLQDPVAVAPADRLPVIALSTTRILKFRPFALFLTMGRNVASRFSEFEIMRAGLGAKCRKEDDLTTNITSCFCTGGKRVIEIGISNKAVFGPTSTPDGVLTYTFDACRTCCSSSRDHRESYRFLYLAFPPAPSRSLSSFHQYCAAHSHNKLTTHTRTSHLTDKSRLMIVVDDLPGIKPIFSSPFIVQAREKQKRRIPADMGACAMASSVSDSPTFFGAPPLEKIRRTLVATSAPADSVEPFRQESNGFAPLTEMSGTPTTASTTITTPPTAPPTATMPTGLHVMVRIHSTSITGSETEALAENIAPLIRAISGCREYRWRALPGFLITFGFFDSEDGAAQSLRVVQRYYKNEIRNPYNCDLSETQICCLLSYCTLP